MDVTPQLLQDIEFREKVRGYHPDDVDDFLERVGVAFSELVDRLRQANERAEAAETALSERADVDESTLSRTLVLAQKTADAAIAEANEEADQTRETARAEADALIVSARTEHDELVEHAKANAEREAAALTGPIQAEVERLEARRTAIVEHSSGLEEWLTAQRTNLESVADDLQKILADPERLKVLRPPVVEEPEPSAVDEPRADEPDAEVEAEIDAPPLTLVDSEPEPPSVPADAVDDGDAVTTTVDEAPLPEESIAEPESEPVAPPEEPESSEAAAPEEKLTVDLDSDSVVDEPAVDRPSRVSVVRASLAEEGEDEALTTGSSDSFLEELRRAVEAPTDLVQTEEDRALSAFFEQDDDEPRRRFGRKK